MLVGIRVTRKWGLLFLPWFTIVALIVTMGPVGARDDNELWWQNPEQGEATLELRSDLVSFTVSVSLPGGKALTTLTADNFIVYENGQRQKISYFATVETPVDIVLVIDDSGSMRNNLNMVKRAAEQFVDRMRSQDRAAVVAFGKQVELLADLTHDRATLKSAIRRIPRGTGTAFYDALYLVAREILSGPTGRKAVIVLSDGVDSISYYNFEQASRALEQNGIVAYFIEVDTKEYMIQGLKKEKFILSPSQLAKYEQAFHPQDPRFSFGDPRLFTGEESAQIALGLYRLARSELRRLAERTGGKVFPLTSFAQLNSIYAQIGMELGTLYSIGYYPTNTNHDGTWRSLRVEVNIPGAKVHARSGYWAPSK